MRGLKLRGKGSKMNTCMKRAQAATVRPMLPGETAAEALERMRKRARVWGEMLNDAHRDERGRWQWVRTSKRPEETKR